jgi:riboflavin kinase / FMN adenylyltransferase
MLFSDLATLSAAEPVVLTIGKFDGVHLAHQQLVNSLVERARAVGAQSAVLTFDPHPDEVLRPERTIRYLTTINERAALLNELGVQMMIVLPFSPALAQMSAEQFMAMLCDHVRLRELWVGPDFRLGHKAQGTVPVLREIGERLGYAVHVIPQWTLDGEAVSSTAIRALLAEGRVAEVPHYLGRPFSVQGPVVRGDQRGRTIGFPTANVAFAPKHMLPADGVYVCRVRLLDGRRDFGAVTNLGVRPTFGVLARTLEAHLFDCNEDLYGQAVRVTFLERLRGEQKFNGIDELVAQIGRDAAAARAWLATHAA